MARMLRMVTIAPNACGRLLTPAGRCRFLRGAGASVRGAEREGVLARTLLPDLLRLPGRRGALVDAHGHTTCSRGRVQRCGSMPACTVGAPWRIE